MKKIIKRDYTYIEKHSQDKLCEEIRLYLLDNLDSMKNISNDISDKSNQYYEGYLPFKNTKEIAKEYYSDLRHYGSNVMYDSLFKYDEEDEYCVIEFGKWSSIPNYVSYDRSKYYEVLKSHVEPFAKFIMKFAHMVDLKDELKDIWGNYKIEEVVEIQENKNDTYNKEEKDDYSDGYNWENGHHINHIFDRIESSFEQFEGLSGLPSGLNISCGANTQVSGGDYAFFY